VIETGTFDELTRLGGHLAELARTQFMVTPAKATEDAIAASPLVET
jgi:hypothetical protein